MGIVYAGASAMAAGNYISQHDQLISEKLGRVMCGGDLTARQEVSRADTYSIWREGHLLNSVQSAKLLSACRV